LIEGILEAIRAGESQGLVRGHDESVLTGFSGRKLIGTLQRLAHRWESAGDACYLEIGVFQGLTLLSVAAANSRLPCYGIDNFAYFDPERKNLGLVMERRARLKAENATVINLDYEDALEDLGSHVSRRKVAVFFVDGPHDYRSQLMCLELAVPHLHDEAVIVVDDCNYRHVRQANRDFLVTRPEYALVFEAYTTCHPSHMTKEENAEAQSGWWNGVNIIARDPSGRIARSYPPTLRSRALHENEHIVHAMDVAPHAVAAIRAAQALDQFNLPGLAKATLRLYRELRATRGERRGLYQSLNTYSAALPKSRYCTHTSPAGGAPGHDATKSGA
jgi:hypothetical protein